MKYQFREKFAKGKERIFHNLGSGRISEALGKEYDFYHRYSGKGRPRKFTTTKEQHTNDIFNLVNKQGYIETTSFAIRLKPKKNK